MPRKLQKDICNLDMEVIVGKFSALSMPPTIMEAIRGSQLVDPLIEELKYEVIKDKRPKFLISEDGVLVYKGVHICVPNNDEIKK